MVSPYGRASLRSAGCTSFLSSLFTLFLGRFGILDAAWRFISGRIGDFADFDLPVAYSALGTWLRIHCRPIEHTSVTQREPRAVPRTLDAIAAELSLRQRPAQMGAGFSKGKNPLATTNQQNRHSVIVSAFQFSLRQLRFRKNRFKILRKFFAAGVVYSDLLLINQVSTQIGCSCCHRISQYREAATRSA